jgi:hypothetical protein
VRQSYARRLWVVVAAVLMVAGIGAILVATPDTRLFAQVSEAWQLLGPEPIKNEVPTFGGVPLGAALSSATGRVTAIVADPTSSGRLFVGIAAGGVWMRANSSSAFVLIFDAQPTLAIGAFALDTTTSPDPTLYVARARAICRATPTMDRESLFRAISAIPGRSSPPRTSRCNRSRISRSALRRILVISTQPPLSARAPAAAPHHGCRVVSAHSVFGSRRMAATPGRRIRSGRSAHLLTFI